MNILIPDEDTTPLTLKNMYRPTIINRAKRFWHCLTHLHRMLNVYCSEITFIGCAECNKDEVAKVIKYKK